MDCGFLSIFAAQYLCSTVSLQYSVLAVQHPCSTVRLQHSILALQYPCSTAGLCALQLQGAVGWLQHLHRMLQLLVLSLCLSTPTECGVCLWCLVCGVHRKHVVEKVLKLLQRKERWLVVAGVRFLRTCIGTKVTLFARSLKRTVSMVLRPFTLSATMSYFTPPCTGSCGRARQPASCWVQVWSARFQPLLPCILCTRH